MTKTCPKCGYEWESRKSNPKCCPSCKQYFERKRVKSEKGEK